MVCKKGHLVAAVLLLVYSILIAEEILLNQVLCYKGDGSVDLEFAFCGFKCECPQLHSGHAKHGERLSFCLNDLCCFNLLTGNSLFDKEFNIKINSFKIVKLFDFTNEFILFQLSKYNHFRSFFKLLPLTKFLYSFSSHKNNVILNC